MSAAEFDALSPRDLGDLITILEEDQRAADYRAGIIVSVMANINAGKDTEPYHPADFFPSLEILRPGPASDADVVAKLEAIARRPANS